jgi:predicted amidohydrolase YtcJ
VAAQGPERVLAGAHLRPQDGQRELGHLVLEDRPVRLGVGQRAEEAEARDVVGVHDLDMGKVRPRVRPAVRLAGRLDGIEGVADRPVAERVVVGLEPERVEPDRRGLEGLGVDEVEPRVVGRVPMDVEVGLEQIDELVERRANGVLGRYAATSVKLMCDGIIENGTAAMLQPYFDVHGHATDNSGLDFIDAETLKAATVRLDALGFQPHFHALGDRAVRHALDAVQAARATNGWSDTRPHLAHIQVVHPDDIPRFRLLGALPNAQPYWAVLEDQMTELTLPVLGPEVSARQYPFRSLRRHGATLVMGSDWSVSTPDPLLEMEIAVTRVSDESRGEREPFLPHERLELVDALTAFTAGSAYANHLDETGTLAVGKLADLAIIDRDLFDEAAGPIGEASVLATFVDGVAVHEAPGLD